MFFGDNFPLEAASDIMSNVAVEYVGTDVFYFYFRSNLSRDIRAAQFVMDNERRRTQVVT